MLQLNSFKMIRYTGFTTPVATHEIDINKIDTISKNIINILSSS